MVKLDIKIYPDKILREKALSIGNIGQKERELAFSMIETMRSSAGIGLAAPQVGITKRIIVIDALEGNESPLILFNPKIIRKKGRSSFCEGCLSVPGITSDITRSESVSVEYLTLEGNALEMNTDGLLARIIQHEVDHLDGILFIDRVGFLKRRKIMREISSKICMKL